MRKKTKRAKGKGIYFLPNFLTSMSLFSVFYSIISTIHGKFSHAAIAIFVSAIFDALDGRVARITGSNSKFGVEYDSLSDVIAFGVAPSLLAYLWALKGYGRFGWVAAALFVACGAVRLARFNIQVETVQKKHFLGLPIPAAASVVASCVLFCTEYNLFITARAVFVPILVFLLAILMVSNVRYYSFKDMEFLKRRPFGSTVIGILLLVIVAIEPEFMLIAITLGYAISGPVYTLVKRKKIILEDARPTTEAQAGKGGLR